MSREQPVIIELNVEDGECFGIVPEIEHWHTDNITQIDGRRTPT